MAEATDRGRGAAGQRQASLRDLPPAFWPSSAAVDALEAQAAKLRREGVAHPYVSPDLKAMLLRTRPRGSPCSCALKAFLPFWASGELPGEGEDALAHKGMLPWNKWHAAFDAYSAAAAAYCEAWYARNDAAAAAPPDGCTRDIRAAQSAWRAARAAFPRCASRAG